jgi:hypothetical protein
MEYDSTDPGDQVFFSQLDHAAHGDPYSGQQDETNQFADNLNDEVNGMQAQTDQAIADAEHSPGFGAVNPATAEVLRAYGIDDGIRASDYQDFEDSQADIAADAAVAGGDEAIGDAQAALETPDGSADQ